MNRATLSTHALRKIKLACRAIQHGGLIAYPTEAVYGLGCHPLDGDAVMALLKLKQRPVEKGLILIASTLDQLTPFIDLKQLPTRTRQQIQQSWPGPITWIVPAQPHTPWWLTGHRNSIAVRITNHPLARALCEHSGTALVSTSANPYRHPPAHTALQVHKYFHGQLDAILNGDVGDERNPTRICHAISGKTLRL